MRNRQRPRWAPILGEFDARRAIEAAKSIADDLASPTALIRAHAHEIALLHAYLGRALDDARIRKRAEGLLEQAIDRVAEEALDPSLYRGFSGIGWVVEHLGDSPAGVDASEELDATILELARSSAWSTYFDVSFGVLGFGLYALERLPRAAAAQILVEIVSRLRQQAEHGSFGCRWLTPPERLVTERRKQSPHGHYDLGVPHGIAGVIGFLAAVVRSGIATEAATSLLDGATRWLLEQRLVGASSTFPFWVSPGVAGDSPPARAAWCYGDPGISLSLLRAAETRGRDDWRDAAVAIARTSALRPAEEVGVVDACLCHGAAGLGHIYHRMFRATRDEVFRRAAADWFRRCLDLRRTGKGIGGYRVLHSDGSGDGKWTDDPSLVSGAAGVGLALLAAVSDVEPEWDRMMLMSIADGA